jgi:hypothetical protein
MNSRAVDTWDSTISFLRLRYCGNGADSFQLLLAIDIAVGAAYSTFCVSGTVLYEDVVVCFSSITWCTTSLSGTSYHA